jgi:hypothetical protein
MYCPWLLGLCDINRLSHVCYLTDQGAKESNSLGCTCLSSLGYVAASRNCHVCCHAVTRVKANFCPFLPWLLGLPYKTMTDPFSCHLPQGAKARCTALVTVEIVFKDWISHAWQKLLRYLHFSKILSQKPVGPMLPSSDKKLQRF